MSQKDSSPDNHQEQMPSHALHEQSQQSMKALGNLMEAVTPWLFSFGNWIFGGLIAFNLLVMASLITVGPVHPAILVSITAFVCALPLNVIGLFWLRLIQDMKDVAIDDVTLRAFQDAGFPNIEAYFPSAQEKVALHKRRSDVALRYSIGVATLSITFTLVGMVAALWYMAWWISVVFIAVVILSLVLFGAMIARSMPPKSAAEKELERRFAELRTRQRNESHQIEHDR